MIDRSNKSKLDSLSQLKHNVNYLRIIKRVDILKKLLSEYSDLLREWNPTKNGELKPEEFTSGNAHENDS